MFCILQSFEADYTKRGISERLKFSVQLALNADTMAKWLKVGQRLNSAKYKFYNA